MAGLAPIEHIVVLMFENRSFDNLLGWLYDGDAPKVHVGPAGPRPFDGLAGLTAEELAKYRNRLVEGGRLTLELDPIKGASASNSPAVNPHEPYRNVNQQLFGNEITPVAPKPATMTGFLQDFATRTSSADIRRQIMETYTRDQAPIINDLAKSYAVSDAWFSSVPTQTNPNRAFAHCGTSIGRTENENARAKEIFNVKTMFNVLDDHQVSWAVFYHVNWLATGKCYTAYTFPQAAAQDTARHFLRMSVFYERARAGTLPAFSFLEPSWYLGLYQGNDYHPPADTYDGENLLSSVVHALQSNPDAWKKTLLVVTFDEHGGTFDHVSPPWGAVAPDSYSNPGNWQFKFDRFGVRVPTLLISPWIAEKTVFRSKTSVPYDHTSIIATVFKWKNIPRPSGLGARVAAAPTFEDVLTLDTPRTIDSQPGDLRFEEPVYLRLENYLVSGAQVGAVGHYFARSSLSDPMDHRIIGGFGSVMNNAVVRIQTTETAVGALDTLGQFTAARAYYHKNQYPEQAWRIVKADDATSTGPIKYDEPVLLLSHDNQNLVQDIPEPPYIPGDTEFLSAKRSRPQRWRIVRAASRYRIGEGLFGSGPALGVFQGQLRTAWLVDVDQIQIDGAVLDGFRSTDRPALAHFGGRLYLAYRDPHSSGIFIASSADGVTFRGSTVIVGAGSAPAPALGVHGDRLWVAWKGVERNPVTPIYATTFDGTSWTSRQDLLDFETSASPAVAELGGTLYLAWKEADAHSILIARHTILGWSSKSSLVRLPVGTSTGPALAALDGKLVCAWRGADPHPRIYMSTYSGGDWSPGSWSAQEWIAGPETNDPPALAHHDGLLYLGWRGRGPTLGEMFVRPFPTFY